MSEYQYYEFQAIDRPLTEREMRELRAYSTRATITPACFVNFYTWGNFKGNASAWMERYFDAFIYFANWGEHELMLRLPRRLLDPKTVQRYCHTDSATARTKGDVTILTFISDEPSNYDDADDGTGWLSTLVPLRADIANSDVRALYLGWLLAVQKGEIDDDENEPPCPPGLRTLSAPLQAFADFFCLDRDLLAVAAERSPERDDTLPATELRHWIAALPDKEKTDLLLRLVQADEAYPRAELLRRFHADRPSPPAAGARMAPRTASELLEATAARAERRQHKEAVRAQREQERCDREAEATRNQYLDQLAKRETKVWRTVDTLIGTRQPARYDKAVALLRDLLDLGHRQGCAAAVEDRIRRLRNAHAKKSSFLDRLERARLGGRRK